MDCGQGRQVRHGLTYYHEEIEKINTFSFLASDLYCTFISRIYLSLPILDTFQIKIAEFTCSEEADHIMT